MKVPRLPVSLLLITFQFKALMVSLWDIHRDVFMPKIVNITSTKVFSFLCLGFIRVGVVICNTKVLWNMWLSLKLTEQFLFLIFRISYELPNCIPLAHWTRLKVKELQEISSKVC